MRMLALLLLVLFCARAQAASEDLSAFSYDQRPGSQVPLAAQFKDETGAALTLGRALGQRPTILALGYFHCPNLCGLVRADLLNALSDLGRRQDYSLVVLSIDPAETHDDAKAARLADSAQFGQPGAASRWHYLTGSARNIRGVTDAVGFRSRFDEAQKQFLHPAGIVFLTGGGTVSSYLLGLGYKPRDVGLGITRAANGVTARALPILLLCFHYDPTTGRYTLAVTRMLQLGAVLTIIAVASTIFLALRRERRPR